MSEELSKEELDKSLAEMNEIVAMQATQIKALQQQNKSDRMTWRLAKIHLMEQLVGKKAADMLSHITTTREKIEYIMEFYKEEYPDSHKNHLLMLLLIWKYIDGIPISASIFQGFENRNLTIPETVARTLRLMKEEGEIVDRDHNAERFVKERIFKTAIDTHHQQLKNGEAKC